MVEKFCELYGTRHSFPKGTLEQSGVELENSCFHDFPSLQQLKKYLPNMENDLRRAGFGYRCMCILYLMTVNIMYCIYKQSVEGNSFFTF